MQRSSSPPAVLWVIVASVLVLGSRVGASEPTLPPESPAVQAFVRGRALLAEKRFDQACALFEQSHGLEPALGTLLNLADCSEQQGHWANAFRWFLEAARWAQRTGERRREEVARLRAEALRQRLVLLVVDVAAPSAMAQVRTVPQLSLVADFTPSSAEPLALDPGFYELRVTAPGTTPSEQRLDLTRPGETRVVVALAPVPVDRVDALRAGATPASAVPAPAAPGDGLRTLTVAGIAVGSVLVLAGLGGIIYSQGVMTRVGRQQPGGPDAAAPTVTRREFETAQVLYPLAIGGAAVGLAALGSVGVLRVASSGTSVAAVPLQGGALVSMEGRF